MFVWSVLAVMFLAGLAYVLAYGHSMPFVDDWLVVPFISGERSLTLGWLWEQNAQNRHAPCKAILVGLVKIAGGDFRVVPLLNLLAVGAMALALIRAAARLRGKISFVDAFFPLLLFNWGLRPYLVLASDIVYHTWPTILALTLLVVIVRRGTALTLSAGLLAGTCLLLLTLTKGILYTPAMALWLGISGYRLRCLAGPEAKWKGNVLIILGSTAALLMPFYFIGFDFDNPYGLATDPSLREQIRVSLGFLAAGFAMRTLFWQYVGSGVLALLLFGFVILLQAMRRSGTRDQSRAQALLLYMAAVGALVFAVGVGREAMGVAHSVRYHLLAIPILCLIYYVWGLHPRRVAGFAIQLALFAGMGLATLNNTGAGLDFGRTHRARLQAFERDIRKGVPPHRLVARYKRSMLYWGTHEDLADYLHSLKRAGIEPFGQLREDPVFHEVPLATTASDVRDLRWEGATALGSGPGSQLAFKLESPMLVAGIRLLCSHSHPENADFEAIVDRTNAAGQRVGATSHRLMSFPGGRPVCGPLDADPQPLDIYVDDRISGFRIHPDSKPFAFRVSAIRLLVAR